MLKEDIIQNNYRPSTFKLEGSLVYKNRKCYITIKNILLPGDIFSLVGDTTKYYVVDFGGYIEQNKRLFIVKRLDGVAMSEVDKKLEKGKTCIIKGFVSEKLCN